MTKFNDWSEFLSKHDLVWKEIPWKCGYPNPKKQKVYSRLQNEWSYGAFLGNGTMGSMTYLESKSVLKWELGNTGAISSDTIDDIDWCREPRVRIGDLRMDFGCEIKSSHMRQHLWDAKITGDISTKNGEVSFESFVSTAENVLILDCTSNTENLFTISVRPWHGISQRMRYEKKGLEEALTPPYPTITTQNNCMLSTQHFIDDKGEIVIAWREVEISNKHKRVFLSVEYSSEHGKALDTAIRNVNKAVATDLEAIKLLHQSWWHDFYKKSFLSIPDNFWESFYWIQMYKLGSTVREKSHVIDSQGPWLSDTSWPTTVWNLNVQLSYMPVFISNHANLAKSLIDMLYDNIDILKENAKPIGIDNGAFIGRSTNTVLPVAPWPNLYEAGNLTWALHSVYRYCVTANDVDIILNKLFPLLKASQNFLIALTYKGEDNFYHIKKTTSPEYPSDYNQTMHPVEDCNYTLACMKWGLSTLLWINSKYDLHDNMEQTWKNYLDGLVEYPVDKTGFMIGKDLPYAISHRHYSHMLCVYPLENLDLKDEHNYNLVKKSLEHFIGFEGALRGYSFTGASSICSLLKDGDGALNYLNGLKCYLEPNTMYIEGGPVIETPLSAAESIQNMLVHSQLDKNMVILDVFPAVPHQWKNVCFENFAAFGGILVSASLKNGLINNISIEATANISLKLPFEYEEECYTVYVHNCKYSYSEHAFSIVFEKDGIWEISLNGYSHSPYYKVSSPCKPIFGNTTYWENQHFKQTHR